MERWNHALVVREPHETTPRESKLRARHRLGDERLRAVNETEVSVAPIRMPRARVWRTDSFRAESFAHTNGDGTVAGSTS